MTQRFLLSSVACRGGAHGATASGIHPGGIQGASFCKKIVGKWKKIKRKMSLQGHDAAWEGASRE